MGLLIPFGRRSQRFWTKEQSLRTLAGQKRAISLALERLADHSLSTEDELKMEFFFRTDSRRKASALAGDLEMVGCQVEQQRSSMDEQLIIVTGWTPPIIMTPTILDMWTERMCRLGYEHDCRFDGWETTLG